MVVGTKQAQLLLKAAEGLLRFDNGIPTANAAMCCAIRIHPENADELYAAFTDGAIYASSDAGESWRLLSTSHPKLYGLQVFRVG